MDWLDKARRVYAAIVAGGLVPTFDEVDDLLEDPFAADLLRRLRVEPAGLTRNQLMNAYSRKRSSEQIGQALGILLQRDLVRCERQPTKGRPAQRWFAVPPDPQTMK
jgi:hypothetical protein